MSDPAPPQPAPPAPAPAPQPDTAPAPAGGEAAAGVPASAWGFLDGEGFAARLGRAGLRLTAAQLDQGEINLTDMPQPVPGLQLKSARFNTRQRRLDITSDIAIPHVARGEFTVRVNSEGTASVHGTLRRNLELPALGNPRFTLELDEEGQVSGEVTVNGVDLLPGRMRGASATGSGTLRIAAGKVSGNGEIAITYTDLGSGNVNFVFSEAGDLTATGSLRITPPFLNEASGDIAVDENQNITVNATLAVGQVATSVPNLTLDAGSLTFAYMNGTPTASLTGFRATYGGFGQVQIDSAELDRNRTFAANGSFNLLLQGLAEVSGTVRVAGGNVSGSVTISANDLPEGLPVTGGSVTGTLSETGSVGFSGSLNVDLGPGGRGTISASYSDTGDFSIGGDFSLTIPGLTTAQVSVAYTNGDLSGEVSVPIDTAVLPGIDGSVTVRYAQNRWSGETTIQYTADNGKLSGTLNITVAQAEDGSLQLGGGGSVTAQLMPRLSGTLQAQILPEGGIDISGAIEVTEPLELFPEKRLDKELFKYSQNIPLWAILVAVIRVRAGVRAGIGPGVFRNIRVEGSYTIGAEEADPSFTVSGELFIPAFVEGYVAFGAGLGLDVVLGSLTGGIEGVATAGIYGAISVVPELSYADGDWGIEGTATMAAGARLKLGLNAWAEVEALWITVWEQEWKLAEYVMNVGPDLALQAKMSYKFGQPEPPEIEMNTSDIDTESMIQDAMPKDGPAGSGAREALENKAEWQGALREQRAAAAVPPEVAAEAQTTDSPPEPATQRPPRREGGPPADQGGVAGTPGASTAPSSQGAPGAQNAQAASPEAQNQANADAARTDRAAQGTVTADEVPGADQPRYPSPVTLESLNEPPAPMPRTAAQQQEDVNAAERVVRLASDAASDTDTLDAYFPAIKQRFRLASLGYTGDFDRGFKVHGEVNPGFDFEPNEPLRGTGLPENIADQHLSIVTWETSTVGGSMVGMKMEADPLGPDHPQGSEPQGSAQRTLMDQLPTDPAHFPGKANRYIRGHLLNHWIGGPGTPRNMFPITAEANAQHNRSIEESVKDWVNQRRLWVKYTVVVESDEKLIKQGTMTVDGMTQDYYAVNGRFVAEASVLDTKLKPVPNLTRKVTITSTYTKVETVTSDATEDTTVLNAQTARDIDLNADLELPESSGPPTMPPEIENGLKEAIRKYRTEGVKSRLRTFAGFGDVSERVLFKAYDEVKRRSDKTVNGLAADERATFTRIRNSWGAGLGATLL